MTKNKGGFSSWKVQRRTYRERSQPAFRKNVGPLEKHKDYVVRSRKYHQAEERKKYLQSLARSKNADEYSVDMAHAHQNDKGVTIVEKLPEVKLLPHEEAEADAGRYELRKPQFHLDRISKKKSTLVRAQSSSNINILRTRWTKVKKEIEKIREGLHFVDVNAGSGVAGGESGARGGAARGSAASQIKKKRRDEYEDDEEEEDGFDGDDDEDDMVGADDEDEDDMGDEDEDDGDDDAPSAAAAAVAASGGRKHTVFVDSDDQLDSFDPQRYFDTHPLLAGRVFNRPRQETLLSMQRVSAKDSMQIDRKIRQNHKAQLKKLQRLMEQEELLRKAIREVEIATSLATEKSRIERIEKDPSAAQAVVNPKTGKSSLRDEYKSITAIKYKQERKR